MKAASDRPQRSGRTRNPAAGVIASAVMAGLLLAGCRDAQTGEPAPPSAAAAPETAPSGAPASPNDNGPTPPSTAATDPGATPNPNDNGPTPSSTAATVDSGADSDDAPPGPNEPPLASYVEKGGYAVGVREVYFHDPARPFDSWNAVYASDGYQATLKEINDAGETQIVPAHMWYPVDDPGSAPKATLDDFTSSISRTFRSQYEFAAMSFLFDLVDAEGRRAYTNQGAMQSIMAAARGRIIDSHYRAPIAGGRFPVIIAAHGLGGASFGWTGFAEYMASNGYVVVAPSFIADSSLPNALNSPDSKYAQSSDAAAVDRAYQTIMGEFKVIPSFYEHLFGLEPSALGGPLDPSRLKAAPGGPERVGEMMSGFFIQRLADVETIIDGLYSLDKDGDSCAAEYAARGQPSHGAEVCGLFTGALGVENIGVAGHSLGSMTAQFAVAGSDRVAAAVGYNNGHPRYWEPPGIFGDGAADYGQPAGNPGPVMVIHGSEDAFVQSVFRGLMWNTYLAAGGDPEDIWQLEQERALPTDENPQPVARNTYDRATGDKVIISVEDLNHDLLTDNFSSLFSEQNPLEADGRAYRSAPAPEARKAVGQDVLDPQFRGEIYTPLGWGEAGGADVFLPVFIRNYFTKNWFDYYLKGDESAVRFTEDPIEDQGLLDIRSSLPR